MGLLEGLTNVLLILKDHGDDIDLEDFWVEIEFDDTVQPSMILTLNAKLGKFLTTAPLIQKYDRIYLEITDKNDNVLKEVFHVKEIQRSRVPGKGQQLKLICPHQSSNLWKRTVSFTLNGISGSQALDEVIRQLNLSENIGDNDPTVFVPSSFDIATKTGNNLSQNTTNFYKFEVEKPESIFREIGRIEALPVSGGGSEQPPTIRFTSRYDHDTGNFLDEVVLQAYAQGFNKNTTTATFTNIPNVTLKHGVQTDTTTNTLVNTSNETPELSTNIKIVCDNNAGTYPTNYAKFVSAKFVFDSTQFWSVIADYVVGDRVQLDSVVYECITDNTNQKPPNATFWIERPFEIPSQWINVTNYLINATVTNNDIVYKSLLNGNTGNEPGLDPDIWSRLNFLPGSEYSPLTQGDKGLQNWVNGLGGAKYAATHNNRTAMIDPNEIIFDDLHPRTYVRYVASDPDDISSIYLQGGVLPDGFRVLVATPTYTATGGTAVIEGLGDFAGNDINGVVFAGNVAEFKADPTNPTVGRFTVLFRKDMLQDQEIYDYDEGLSWIKKPCNGFGKFVDQDGACRTILGGATRDTGYVTGNYGLFEIPLFGTVGTFTEDKQFSCVHSVRWDDVEEHIDIFHRKLADIDTNEDSGIVITSDPTEQQAPVPVNPLYVGFNNWALQPASSNNIPFTSVSTGEFLANGTLDLNNMYKDTKGNVEWFGPGSEDYLPLNAWAMIFFFFEDINLVQNNQEGDYSITFRMVDRNDQTMLIDITQTKDGDTVPVAFNLPGKSYKGVTGDAFFFKSTEPDPSNAFNPLEVIKMAIYPKDAFDKQGRYKAASAFALDPGLRNRFFDAELLEMGIDAFRAIKPLFVTNVDEPNNKPDRNVEGGLKRFKEIISHAQAKDLVLGLEKYENFQRQEFQIDVSGRCDVKHGDPVYYTDTEQVDDTTDSLDNTLKMVVLKNVITLNKTPEGEAGFRNKFHIATRVWPDT